MNYLKKSIIYLAAPSVLVIVFSIWIGATITTDKLTPDEASVIGIQQRTVVTETKDVSPELKPLRDIFAIKKQMELPPISEILPQPKEEEPKVETETKKAEPEIKKVSYNLMLILMMEDKKIAMINGKTLKEGDILADNTIVKTIEAERVLLVSEGKEEWLFIR